jgi:hypothetical protein
MKVKLRASTKATTIATYFTKLDRLLETDVPTMEDLMMVTFFDPEKQQWRISPMRRPSFIVRCKLCLRLLFDSKVRLIKI